MRDGQELHHDTVQLLVGPGTQIMDFARELGEVMLLVSLLVQDAEISFLGGNQST